MRAVTLLVALVAWLAVSAGDSRGQPFAAESAPRRTAGGHPRFPTRAPIPGAGQ